MKKNRYFTFEQYPVSLKFKIQTIEKKKLEYCEFLILIFLYCCKNKEIKILMRIIDNYIKFSSQKEFKFSNIFIFLITITRITINRFFFNFKIFF